MKYDEKKLVEIAEKFELAMIVLFGSQATEKTHSNSDVDLAVQESNALTYDQENELRIELKHLMGKEVDVAFVKRATPLLLGQIARYGKLLYGTTNIFTTFRTYAMKKYLDFSPYFELENQVIKRKLESSHA